MKSLNWLLAGTLALGATLSAAGCSSKQKAESEETDPDTATATLPETVERTPGDPVAALFVDESKASQTATDSTYATTPSGLRYLVIREGKGVSPKAQDAVEVHYEGKLVDGTIFDSSYDRGETATFPLNAVIPGWTEGLQLMKEGGKTIFYIPARLAYGQRGVPGTIPPDSDLIFTVELLKVVK